MSKVELTNMCMIYDPDTNRVLVQERVKSWKGLSFPGGHVEEGESLVDSTIREVREETGLTVSDLKLCGIVYWYNNETGDKYFVFSYRTSVYEGQLIERTEEGPIYWVDKDELPNLPLSEGLKERLPMFWDDNLSEAFGVWNEQDAGVLKLR
ncbi:8-oxo-dGTP diphosphatase [Paenibacillaceae sp. P-4]|uniref:NUDIX domain-containing protein n=1 Tax=Paenibacillaceae bacterium P-4 TaxID=3160969 RepID=UPI0032E83E20